ncbi:MAG: ATP-binding cassette domain-containing protein [Chthoniobacterales bacterium]|nr:ATP-binding cassette domain-containing protein [Chthoniobacterales bacterium]
MHETEIIQVCGLTAGYAGRVILQDISFSVRRGEVFMILGGSGSGKSTLLKNMIGLHPALGGEVLIGGEDIVGASGAARQRILRKFGVMYQGGALFGSMTLAGNVALPLEEWTKLPAPARHLLALLKLQQVGLGEFADYLPSEISGGMQKRAAVARAMALDPGILFLDEPSAGLDPITSAELDELIRTLSRNLGITFVIASHELASIYAIGDRAIILEKGSIAAEGTPVELRDHPSDDYVRAFFRREPQKAVAV